MKGNLSTETIKPSPIIETSTDPKPEQKGKPAISISLILLLILAIAGIGFGIYELIQAQSAERQLTALKAEINNGSKTEKEIKVEVNNDSKTEKETDSFVIYGMNIKIKGLETPVGYSLKRGISAPYSPRRIFTISHSTGIPTFSDGTAIGTDSIPAYEAAVIYEYDSEEFYENADECSVKIGKVGENYYCVERLSYPEEFDTYYEEGEIKDAWVNWFNAGTDKIMETLSNPDNYSAV